MSNVITVYQDAEGRWGYALRDAEGNTTFTSSADFETESEALSAAAERANPDAPVSVDEAPAAEEEKEKADEPVVGEGQPEAADVAEAVEAVEAGADEPAAGSEEAPSEPQG